MHSVNCVCVLYMPICVFVSKKYTRMNIGKKHRSIHLQSGVQTIPLCNGHCNNNVKWLTCPAHTKKYPEKISHTNARCEDAA